MKTVLLVSVVLASFLCSAHPWIRVNAQNNPGTKFGKSFENFDIEGVREALSSGANPNEKYSGTGLSALSRVFAFYSMTSFITNKPQMSLEEAQKRAIAIYDLLFKADAKLSVDDLALADDRGILHSPIIAGAEQVVRYLLEHGADVNGFDYRDGNTNMILAVKYERKHLIDLLSKYGANSLDSASIAQIRFIQAARKSDIIEMRSQLSKGATIDGRDLTNRTALVEAVGGGESQAEAVKFLLEMKANPNSPGRGFIGMTSPLHIATENHQDYFKSRGEEQVIRLLLKAGADVSSTQAYQMQTPLHIAVTRQNVAATKLLLEAGAKLDIKDMVGKTPLDYAKSGEVIQLLKSFGERPVAPVTANESRPNRVSSDVDNPPAARMSTKTNAHALVIGIETYRGKLPKADFADRDAKVMGEYLTKVLGYPEENVVVLDNENATRTDMEKYIEGWLPNRVEKDASVFFYFSGHGTPNTKTGDAYLVPYDGDPAFLEKTGYPMQRLYEQLGKLPTKEVVVVLDTCFSGAGGRSVLAQGARPMVLSIENPILAGGKTLVMAASSGSQTSSTYRQKSHGLLTYFFLKGLQGEADQNKDGAIDLAELFEYVKPQVERVARREFNNQQTPQLLGSTEMLKRGVRLVESRTP